MKRYMFIILCFTLFPSLVFGDEPEMSKDTEMCLECHGYMNPGIVSAWKQSSHAKITPAEAIKKSNFQRLVSAESVPDEISNVSVGCAECHLLNPDKHKDTFDHNDYMVHSVVTPADCAACHPVETEQYSRNLMSQAYASLLVSDDGDVISERTHAMNDRLPLRLFGLIYAHAHPKSPDTAIIKNSAGLPLPTDLTGESAADYLISKAEQNKRQSAMQKVCLACHSLSWVEGHFDKLDKSIETTNEMTLTATRILSDAWEHGVAKGLAQNDSIFNESIEKKWIEQWLFYANSIRFASAMAGTDYGAFENGRWHMSKNIQEMTEWLEYSLKEKKENIDTK